MKKVKKPMKNSKKKKDPKYSLWTWLLYLTWVHRQPRSTPAQEPPSLGFTLYLKISTSYFYNICCIHNYLVQGAIHNINHTPYNIHRYEVDRPSARHTAQGGSIAQSWRQEWANEM